MPNPLCLPSGIRIPQCFRIVFVLLCCAVTIFFLWWTVFQNRERDDLRPVLSWQNDRMAALANEQRSNEEEVVFQRLNFEYKLRNEPPEESEVRFHQHQDSLPNCDGDQWRKEAAEDGRCPYRTETRFPVLIWWTPITYFKHLIRRCTYGRCVFTHNRRELHSPRNCAVLFDGKDLKSNDIPLPRKDSVEWMLIHRDAPHLAPLLYSKLALSLFNVTATFSRQSDYPLTLQHLDDIDSLKRTQAAVSLEKKRAAIKAGGALVVYKSDECDVPSDRDHLVGLLIDLLPVDLFGMCPDKGREDSKNNSRRFNLVGWEAANRFAAYKFSLVFESDVCADYIGSGLWQALSYGVVPVYFGDAEHLASLLPHPKSAIFVSDFQSLPALVQYLKKLDADDKLYRKHLQHLKKTATMSNKILEELYSKRSYGQSGSPLQEVVDGFECFACDKVYEQLLAKAYSKPAVQRVANESHFSCHEPQPYSRSSSYSWHQRWLDGKKNGDALYRAVQSADDHGRLSS